MGYEIKLYLGTYHDINLEDEEEHYFQQVAWIDLCKIGDSHLSHIDTSAGQKVYFYGIDGNTKITSDPYGDSLRAIPAQIVLDTLKKDWEASTKEYPEKFGYRRFYMAIPLLERFIKTFPDPYIVIYGH